MTSAIGCTFLTNSIMTVTDSALKDLATVTATHVFNGTSTAIQITGAASAFAEGPRVYITPMGNPDAQAVALRAVDVRSDTVLTGVIKAGLTVGTYAVVVVNQNGTIHIFDETLIPAPLTVVGSAVPVIISINPFAATMGGSLQIFGRNLGLAADGGNIVTLRCVGKADAILTGTPASADGSQLTITVASTNAELGTSGDYCVVAVKRLSDNAEVEYSAVVFSNPSNKLNVFYPNVGDTSAEAGQVGGTGQTLQAAKRAAAVAVASVTESSKYLYVLGGCVSTNASLVPISTVESCEVSKTGLLGSFSYQPQNLPEALAFARARSIGRFLYVVGGSTGAAASAKVYRAQVLSPLETSSIDIDLLIVPQATPTPVAAGGLYYYRVAALFGPSDANNPDGESLPGELLNVQLPAISDASVTLRLTWQLIPNAVGYFLYRTPVAGAPLSQLTLLAFINSTTPSFNDDGSAGVGGRSVVKPGRLGNWQQVATLETPRWAFGLTHTRSNLDTNKIFLYAVMGATHDDPTLAPGTFTNTYGLCTIIEAPPTAPRGSYTQSVTCSNSLPVGTATARGWTDALLLNEASAGVSLGGKEYVMIPFGGTGSTTSSKELTGAQINMTDGSLVSVESTTTTKSAGTIGGATSLTSGVVWTAFGDATQRWTAAAPSMPNKLGWGGGLIDGGYNLAGFPSSSIANLEGALPASPVAYSGYTVAVGRMYIAGGWNPAGAISDQVTFATII